MKEYLVDTCQHPRFGGLCMLFKFNNNYGASVIRHDMSKGGKAGLFELAALQFDEKDKYRIIKDACMTDNTIGYLFWEEVIDLLQDIKKLS
jgi:hypothetical protein